MTQRARYQPKAEIFPSDLRALFRDIARWAVASSFAAAGCADTTESSMNAPWQEVRCDELGVIAPEIAGPASLDYIAAVRFESSLAPTSTPPAFLHKVAERGEACSGATDRSTCEAAVAAELQPPATCPCEDPKLVITRGDEVLSVSERADYVSVFGTIDTPDEAVLAAFLAGHEATCGTLTRSAHGSYEIATEWEACSAGVFEQTSEVGANGEVMVGGVEKIDESGCAIGRRPEGLLCASAPRAQNALGRYFASAARLEAASVFAFDRLARELVALGAPDPLVQRAKRSAIEEIRHARIVGALATRYGAAAQAPSVAAEVPRSPFAFALENAVEGCVRETFGAVLACHQAMTARDGAVREAMQLIAEDELRHAELAWAIAAWLEPQLDELQRAKLADARAEAFAQLLADDDSNLSAAERSAIGWPEPEVCREVLTRLQGFGALA